LDNIIGLYNSVKADEGYSNSKIDVEQIINDIKAMIEVNDLDSAEELIKYIFSIEQEYNSENPEDIADRLVSFDEPIEEEYFNYKYKISRELKREPKVRTELFLMLAYILVERKEYDEALKVLDRGISYNPVSTVLLNEKAEIYKTKGQWDIFKEIVDECHEYSYKCDQLSRVYRNYGYMFIEKEDYEGAICAYIASLIYEDNDIAKNELNYISAQTNKSLDANFYINNAEIIFRKRAVKLGPNEDMCELAYVYARNFENLKNYPAALYYYKRLYDLTENDEAKEKSEKLEKLLFEGV